MQTSQYNPPNKFVLTLCKASGSRLPLRISTCPEHSLTFFSVEVGCDSQLWLQNRSIAIDFFDWTRLLFAFQLHNRSRLRLLGALSQIPPYCSFLVHVSVLFLFVYSLLVRFSFACPVFVWYLAIRLSMSLLALYPRCVLFCSFFFSLSLSLALTCSLAFWLSILGLSSIGA